METAESLSKDEARSIPSRSHREEHRRYSSSKETLATKYAAIREQQFSRPSSTPPKEKALSSAKVSLLGSHSRNQSADSISSSSPGLASTWASMKSGFQNFKANVSSKKYIPIPQVQQLTSLSTHAPSESLDEIFQKLKQKPSRYQNTSHSNDDDGI